MMGIKLINDTLLNETTHKAKENLRLRMNFNFHTNLNDPVNRMLNALEPGTYVRPHRHLLPPKTEAYVILRGELDLLIFDEEGQLLQKETLSPDLGNYGVDIPAGVWHGMIVKKSGTVIYEVKEGPFCLVAPEDLASWAPEPDDREGIKMFFEKYK